MYRPSAQRWVALQKSTPTQYLQKKCLNSKWRIEYRALMNVVLYHFNTALLRLLNCVNADGWYVTCSGEEKKSWLWLRKLISTPQSLFCQAISGDQLLNFTVPNCIWHHVTEFRVIAYCSSQQGLLQDRLITSLVAAILDVNRSRVFVIVQSG